MRIKAWLLCVLLLVASSARAQDFGVLESAETINRGNFKLAAYPLFILPDEGDNIFSLAAALGYGATDSIDIEGRVAFSEAVTFVGGDAEFWLVKNAPLDVSFRGGGHFGFADEMGDSAGVDLSLLASAPVAARLELVGALDLAFDSVDIGTERDGVTTVHLVPGIEVALTDEIDFLAEFGLGVTDASSHYVGLGLAFYLR